MMNLKFGTFDNTTEPVGWFEPLISNSYDVEILLAFRGIALPKPAYAKFVNYLNLLA